MSATRLISPTLLAGTLRPREKGLAQGRTARQGCGGSVAGLPGFKCPGYAACTELPLLFPAQPLQTPLACSSIAVDLVLVPHIATTSLFP